MKRRAFRDAVRQPIGRRPLREIVRSADRVAVVIQTTRDRFRASAFCRGSLKNSRTCRRKNFVIINGTGSHRANTPAELRQMVGDGCSNTFES
jgi:nickel-dependent lactate racemase